MSDEDGVCGCGCTKQPLNPARHERLHYEPPVYEVHVGLREQLACPNGCSGEVVLAPKPNPHFTQGPIYRIVAGAYYRQQAD